MGKNDARRLDHATLEAMRERAVRSVQDGESPEVVAGVLRAFPEKTESRDSQPLANQIQASYWQEASMDGKALFGRLAQTGG